MTEVLVKCFTCGKQRPCDVSPIPPMWRCQRCVERDGPWPAADAPKAGKCRAEGGHRVYAVYDTRFGPLCKRHLAIAMRTANWPNQ